MRPGEPRTEIACNVHEICPVCWWEDDPVQFRDPDRAGGANRPSLREARETFRRDARSRQV